MSPVGFKSEYPGLFRALDSMFSGKDEVIIGTSLASDIQRELKEFALSASSMADVLRETWPQVIENPNYLLEHSLNAYRALGVSVEVQSFIGKLWLTEIERWPEKLRQDFVSLILGEVHDALFAGLDFAMLLFRDIRWASGFMIDWLRRGALVVGNHWRQGSFLACVQGFCFSWPLDALRVIEVWANKPMDSDIANTMSKMLHWIRNSPNRGDANLCIHIERLEQMLRAPGHPKLRALFIESWAFEVGTDRFTEEFADNLRPAGFETGSEEELTWCFLLARVVENDSNKWAWAHSEFSRIGNSVAGKQARFWVIHASLVGYKTATDESPISREQWLSLFLSMQPLAKSEDDAWNRVEECIIETLAFSPEMAKRLVLDLAAASGGTWVRLLRSKDDIFDRLQERLLQSDADELIATLCLSRDRKTRLLGVCLHDRGLGNIEQTRALEEADAEQVELLLLQIVCDSHEYSHVARLHASIAKKIDEFGGNLADQFYDEVSTQAQNTDEYRKALAAQANGHVRLMQCIQDATDRIEATYKAAKSPALNFLVPGRERAETLSRRDWSKRFEKGLEEASPLLNFIPTVVLLYGQSWRSSSRKGSLSETDTLYKTTHSAEIPRLESVAPEFMQLRRRRAEIRIDEMELKSGRAKHDG